MRTSVHAVVVILPALALCQEAEAPPEERAAALHAEALEAADAKRWEHAIRLWDRALELAPSWKYAFNQAAGYKVLQRWLLAWRACRRARALGLSDAFVSAAERIEEAAEAQLTSTHAFVALERVVPPDARVTLDGVHWPAPRVDWRPAGRTRVSVTREGYATQHVDIDHVAGERVVRTIELERKNAPLATLRVTGEPAGAWVSVDGKKRCQLPLCEVPGVALGPHRVRVDFSGHAPFEDVVEALATDIATLRVSLAPVGPLDSATPTEYGVAKWATVGSAIAAFAVAGGLFAHAQGLLDELDPNSPDYATTWQDNQSPFETSYASAWTLTGVGAALALTSIVLLVIDGPVEAPTQ